MRTLLPLCLIWALSCTAAAQDRPNVVLILIDDQGYADLGCYGAQGFETPNIDRLAAEGMRFTSYYAAQGVCSASRSAVMTGCYPNRVGVFGAYGPEAKEGLDPSEQTLAELLQDAGYATYAVGKWHLGHNDPAMLPTGQGFDHYYGIPYSNDMWPVDYDGTPLPDTHWKSKHPPLPVLSDTEVDHRISTLEGQGELVRDYTEHAMAFLRGWGQGDRERPFFLYFPHSLPHVPLGVQEHFETDATTRYAEVIEEIDAYTGKLMEFLGDLGVADNTLVVYTSDNGPWMNYGDHAGSALPLREGKGTSWEGGVRVPCIVWWPGHVPAGEVRGGIVTAMDLLPTIAEICGASLSVRKIDGMSVRTYWTGEREDSPRDEMIFWYGRRLEGVRRGKWKLTVPHEYRSYGRVEPGMGGWPGPYARGRAAWELYDLEADVEERKNVADLHPDVVEELRAMAEDARQRLGDHDMRGSEQRPTGKVRERAGGE